VRRPRSSAALSELERYAFDLQGYLLIENALEPRAVDELRTLIDGQRLPPAGETIESQRFGGAQMFAWGRAFCELIDHPLAVSALEAFVGPYVRLDHAYGITMRPFTAGLGLHGPALPFDPAQYYLHRMGAMRSGLLTFAWSLSDGRPGQGGFGCIPGSHRTSQPLPDGAEWLVAEVPQPPGSLLIFTEALVHCTIPWQGDDTRWCVLYKYSPGNSAWSAEPAAPPRTVATMSRRQQLFFQPPSVGGRVPTIG
jgi:hypothetical protein